MVISAWVAVGVFVLHSGQPVVDTAGPFKTEKECVDSNKLSKAEFETKGEALHAFGLSCVKVDVDEANMKKPVPKSPTT